MLATSNDIDIEIDKKQIYHYLGYGADYKPPARISSLVDEYAEHAYYLIEPSYSYVIRDVEWARGSIAFIEDSIIFKNKGLVRLLEQCCQVSVFVATIGKHLEEMACLLAEDGLILQSTVLDAIGSDAVGRLAEFIQGRIAEIASTQGLVTSRRFSPGYCGWDIGQQRVLFWALNGDTVGVRLTGGGLMIPQKSISGVIGIGLSNSNVEHYNPCRTCDKHDCQDRRET